MRKKGNKHVQTTHPAKLPKHGYVVSSDRRLTIIPGMAGTGLTYGICGGIPTPRMYAFILFMGFICHGDDATETTVFINIYTYAEGYGVLAVMKTIISIATAN